MLLKKITELKNSLLFRLTILYAATFFILAFIGFTIFYYRIYSVTLYRIDQELLQDSRIYGELASKSGLPAIQSKIIANAQTEDPKSEFYRLLNTQGEVLISTDMTAWGEVDHRSAVSELKSDDIGYVAHTIRLTGGERARVITTVIGPSLLLQMGETLEETDEYLDIFRNLLTLLVTIFCVISAGVGWYLARQSLSGMGKVTQAAEDITQGNYDRRVEVTGHFREVIRLGAAFNTMLNRIQMLLKSMHQINDNIAHDLRSPLARIRGIAEMTIVKQNTIEHYKDMAVSTIEECDALIDMINSMLDITEIEAGVIEARIERFDLSQLVSEACDLFQPIADRKHILLQSNLPVSILFSGDRKRMQRIVTNLLENAIKYTNDHGAVIVTAESEDGEVQIDIKDTGSGISESDLPYIYQRFYRCDQSRSKSGVGLGLSLVKAYTESMNGTIAVKSTLNKGSVFSLRFAD